MATLFSRTVLPNLATSLQKMRMDPSDQDVQPAVDVLEWKGKFADSTAVHLHC